MSNKLEYLTHDQVHAYYHSILRSMATAQYRPDVIIAPMRGGADMGVKLSQYFDVPVVALQWQTRDGGERDVAKLREVLKNHVGANVLVVDDICDSGVTLQGIHTVVDRFIESTDVVVIDYAVAIHNADCDFEPTWWARTIHRNVDTQWFVFPWEEWWTQN